MTTTWSGSVSDVAGAATQNTVLSSWHPRVQDLVKHLGWRSLRDVQVAASGPVLAADRDVLIVAGTASGKTEAAWLPLLSNLLAQQHTGLGVLALSPLKALIDDQVVRLAEYAKRVDLQVEAWHGDVAATRKQRILREPPAAVMTTPESLQGLLLRRPLGLAQWLAPVQYVLIDEVHAFAGMDRGHQLQSLLTQLDAVVGHPVPRIALSATVSDVVAVSEFLRPGAGHDVTVVRDPGAHRLDLDAKLHGYRKRTRAVDPRTARHPLEGLSTRDTASGERLDIALRIDEDTRGRRAIVFASSRKAVEEMTTLLADEQVTATKRPERYFAHHGSLSAPVRRAAEHAMRESKDTVIVGTSTLELGVDLPHLEQVTQIDTCLSVTSLRQRLGRSGRTKGTRPTLRLHVTEPSLPVAPTEHEDALVAAPPLAASARLRANLMQNMASVHLVLDGWVEPPNTSVLGLSTLVHQTLCLLTSPEGATAQDLYEVLCRRGPWRRVTPDMYGNVLRSLAAHDVVRQEGPRGALHLDEAGHGLVRERDFMAVFKTAAEYSIRHDGREIGSLQSSAALGVGSTLALAGRTWKVVAFHRTGWKVDVVPHGSGLPRAYSGGAGIVHRHVRETMRRLYESPMVPDYLDGVAVELLAEGRAEYSHLELSHGSIRPQGKGTLLALFTGDREQETIRRWLHLVTPGTTVLPEPVGLFIAEAPSEVERLLAQLLAEPAPDPEALAAGVKLRQVGRYDDLLPDDLLTVEYASRMIDVPAARAALAGALAVGQQGRGV